MGKIAKKVRLEPGSDLAATVREAKRQGAAVVFEEGEATYRFVPDPSAAATADIWADYEPGRVLAALRAARGAFSGLDAKEFHEDIQAQRSQDSHGRPAER